MATRRDFLTHGAAAGFVAATSRQIIQAAEDRGDLKPSIARGKGLRIKTLIRREETTVRHGGSGDNWHMSWAADDRQYVSLCDGAGAWFEKPGEPYYNSRLLVVSGSPRDAIFSDVSGYPYLNPSSSDEPRYYNFGTLALDGRIYQFLSTYNRTTAHARDLRFIGVKLIYSPDNGRTWCNQDGSTPVVWEPWKRRSRGTMIFFEEPQDAFSILSVLQMGRNYAANRDGYVYIYAPNGAIEGTMNELVMFRVPKAHILNRGAYEYFTGLRPDGNASWTQEIQSRAVVHTFPRGWVNKAVHPWSWVPSVVYNAPLGLYLMASWGTGSAADGMWFDKPSYLGFWVARQPWGPWMQIHEETAWTPAHDPAARAFAPQISPKWIAADGKAFWLVWSDFQVKDEEIFKRFSAEFSGKFVRKQVTDDDWGQMAAMLRKHKPNYGFNAQRVDLVVGAVT